MKPSFVWDGQAIGPKRLRMPQAIGFAFLNILGATGLLTGAVSLLGFTGIAAVALGVGYAVTIGGAYLLQGLLQKAPAVPKPSDVQTNIRQEISPRRRIFGRYLTGSVVVFGFRRGEKSYILHYVCEGPIGGFVGFRLDKKPVTLDEDGYVQEDQYQVGGRSRVQILTKLGTMSDEPFAELISAFPELDTPLAPFRHRGCAMALQIVEQVPAQDLQNVYPNNMPSLQFLIDGYAEVYDPRTETTGLSGNAGCCLLSEVMEVYGLTADSEEDIDFASFAAFADHCDEDVPLKVGGTEKRYRCAGPLLMDSENEARIQGIAGVCNADVFMDSQGRIAVRQKMRSNPGIALRAKNGDHISVQLEGGRGLQKQFNVAKVTYVDSALNYKANEVRWQSVDLIEEDGVEYPQPVSALLCGSPTQAMRLGKLVVYEGNPEFTGSLVSGPQALDLMQDYVFTLDLAPEDDFERVACASGVIEYDANAMSVSTPLMVFRSGANDWNPAVDEQDQVTVPPELPSYVDDIDLEVTVTVGVLNNSAPVLNFAWTTSGGPAPDSYSHQVEVSAADANEWLPASVNQEDDTAIYGPVADGGAYDWRIRNIAAGRTFDWQVSTTPVTIVVNPTPPIALTSFSTSVSGPFMGGVALVIVTGNDPNLHKVKLYRKASGSPLNVAVDTPFTTLYVTGMSSFTSFDGDATRVNLLANPSFDTGGDWTLTGWTGLGTGKITKTVGTNSVASQTSATASGAVVRIMTVISGRTAGGVRSRLSNGGTVVTDGPDHTANGTVLEKITATGSADTFALRGSSTFDGSAEFVARFIETASCAPQGSWDYYAVPFNISDKPSLTPSGPLSITIV